MTHNICGNCLHSKDSHTEHNGHFMYCACCFTLCDKDEFEQKHNPSNIETIIKLQLGREIGKYTPKEHGADLIK